MGKWGHGEAWHRIRANPSPGLPTASEVLVAADQSCRLYILQMTHRYHTAPGSHRLGPFSSTSPLGKFSECIYVGSTSGSRRARALTHLIRCQCVHVSLVFEQLLLAFPASLFEFLTSVSILLISGGQMFGQPCKEGIQRTRKQTDGSRSDKINFQVVSYLS